MLCHITWRKYLLTWGNIELREHRANSPNKPLYVPSALCSLNSSYMMTRGQLMVRVTSGQAMVCKTVCKQWSEWSLVKQWSEWPVVKQWSEWPVVKQWLNWPVVKREFIMKMCVWERERERKKQTDGQTYIQKYKQEKKTNRGVCGIQLHAVRHNYNVTQVLQF